MLENLIREMEVKIKALEAKKRVAVERGNPELLLVFDAIYSDMVFTLGMLKSAIKALDEIRDLPRGKTLLEIKGRDKELFEIISYEWLRREHKKGSMEDSKYFNLQGQLEMIEWILSEAKSESPK